MQLFHLPVVGQTEDGGVRTQTSMTNDGFT